MDANRSPSPMYYRSRGVTPKNSPTAEHVLKRRLDIEKSERAAYWALFNTSVGTLLYYDLCYLKVFENISIVLVYLEWLVCGLFITSACYDFYIHFWPHTFMRPIAVSPYDKKLLGIQEDEFGFKIEEPTITKTEPTYDSFPPFEIHHSFEEDEKVATPLKKLSQSPDTSLNTSRRSKVVDKESLVEYLKNCQILEDQGFDSPIELKPPHQQSFHHFHNRSFEHSFR